MILISGIFFFESRRTTSYVEIKDMNLSISLIDELQDAFDELQAQFKILALQKWFYVMALIGRKKPKLTTPASL